MFYYYDQLLTFQVAVSESSHISALLTFLRSYFDFNIVTVMCKLTKHLCCVLCISLILFYYYCIRNTALLTAHSAIALFFPVINLTL